jgi:hypothetical protein
MRPLVVVILHPVRQAVPCLLERVEPRPRQEVLLQRLPEPFDLPQGHGMMRRAADVMDMILPQFLLELRLPAPTGVLPPVVREQFLRDPVFTGGQTVRLHDVLARLASEDPQRGQVPRVIIDEPDDVGCLTQDRVVGDVRLPQLVGSRALEPPFRHHRLLARLRRRQVLQPLRLNLPPHRLRTGLQSEHPPQQLRDPPHPLRRVLPLQLPDLLLHRLRQLAPLVAPASPLQPQPRLPGLAVRPLPLVDRILADPDLPRYQRCRHPFLHAQPDRLALHLIGPRRTAGIRNTSIGFRSFDLFSRHGPPRLPPRHPPRGRSSPGGLLPRSPCFLLLLFHR